MPWATCGRISDAWRPLSARPSEVGKHSPSLEWGAVVVADPDVLLVSPCGFDLERTRREMGVLTARSGWYDLGAARSHRVYLVDGNAYFHRPGPRLVESLEILAEILHPEAFAFGHAGRGWVSYSHDAA